MSEKRQHQRNPQKVQNSKLLSPQANQPITKDNLIKVLLQINQLQHNILQSTYEHIQSLMKWLTHLKKLQRILQKQQKLQFFQQVIQIVFSQKKQSQCDNSSKLTKKLIEFAEQTLIPYDLQYKQLLKMLISVIQTNQKDSEKYVSLKDGGKILIRWHFFFSILQNTLSHKLYDKGEYKNNKKIAQLLQQAKSFIKQVILQIFNNKKTNTMINSLICNLFIGFQSLQFPICVLICQSFNEIIKEQFSTQYSKSSNNFYNGICSPDIVIYFLSQFLKVPRITIESEQCTFQEESSQKQKENDMEPNKIFRVICSYCGQNMKDKISQNQNQQIKTKLSPYQKIYLNQEDKAYTLRICQQCQQQSGAYAYLIAIPLTANWRNFQGKQADEGKLCSSVVIESLFLKSVTKKQQKEHSQLVNSNQYRIPQRIVINSIEENFPIFLSTKILYFLFENHPTQGLNSCVQDLRVNIQVMMMAKSNSFKKKVLKLIQSKIIHLLFQDKPIFANQIRNHNFLPQVLLKFKERIIVNWQKRIDDQDQAIVISCLELGSTIFCLQGNIQIIDKIMEFSQKVKSQALIAQVLKAVDQISKQKKILKPQHQSIQFDLICICQVLLYNKAIRSNSTKLKSSIIRTAKQLIASISKNKKQRQRFISALFTKQSLNPKFVVKIIGIDETIFRILNEMLISPNEQSIQYIYQITQSFLLHNRNQILESQNLLNTCFSRLFNKQLQKFDILIDQYKSLSEQNDRKHYLNQKTQFAKVSALFPSLLSFYKLPMSQAQCEKLEKMQIQMISSLKIASPFYIKKIGTLIARVNYTLKTNAPKKYSNENPIYKNFSYKDLFDNQTVFKQYFNIAKSKKDEGFSLERLFPFLLLVIYGIVQIEKSRIQLAKHQSWMRFNSGNSKRRSSAKKEELFQQRQYSPDIQIKALPFTLEVYQFLIKILISMPQQTSTQIQRELFIIIGEFWIQHPQFFSSSQMAVLHLLQKSNQNALLISLVYQSMLKCLKLKNFKQKDQKSIQVIDSIFKKTQKIAFQTSKNDIELRIQFYRVLGVLLKVGKAFQHSYNKYILLGSCDTNIQIQQIIQQILRQQYSLDSSSLFFNLKQNLKFLKFEIFKDSKPEKLYNLNGIQNLFSVNKQKIKTDTSKTKKIDKTFNKRVEITFIKKIGEIFTQHNQLDTDPEFLYFLLQIISKAQVMSAKQFIEIYYSVQQILNQNLTFILNIIKKAQLQNFSQSKDEQTHFQMINNLMVFRRAACIIFCFEYRSKILKTHKVKQIQEIVDTAQGSKDLKIGNSILLKTQKADKLINDYIQGNSQFSKVCQYLYDMLKDMYSQYYQIDNESDQKQSIQDTNIQRTITVSRTIALKKTKKIEQNKKIEVNKSKDNSKVRNKSLPANRVNETIQEEQQSADRPIYNLRNRKKK